MANEILTNLKHQPMRRIVLLFSLLATALATLQAQVVEVSANAGTSATPALGTSNFAANESIYTEVEIGSSNFTSPATAMTRLALNVNTLGTNTTFNNVRIYLRDVPLTSTTFTSGTYTSSGYTLVFDGSITFTATGWTEFALTTPYVRTPGTNLQMLIERTDNVAHTGFVWICANGNNTSSTINTTRRYNATTALSAATVLTVSAFRQAVRFIRRVNNDAAVRQVYTLGKTPIPNGNPLVISANISNDGINALTNVNVSLNVSGANSFTNNLVIPSLASGASTTVSFPTFSPTVEGINNVTVSVGSDDNTSNNSVTVSQSINKNTWSYAYGPTASAGVGFNGATGDFVAKFSTNQNMALAQVSVNFFAGGQPYQIGVWDATGAGGTPGNLIYSSSNLVATTGTNVIPILPAVNVPAGNFFVGVRQIGTTNVSFGYQTETPIRSQTFYFTSPSGGTTWTDFAPSNSFRFLIEPKLILPVDASATTLNTPNNNTCFSTPQTYSAVITNTGANAIAPGSASVTLRIRGANVFTGTLANSTNIASGGTETINFTNVNLPNGGTNLDTLIVNLDGDLDRSNDTLRTSNVTASTLTSFPVTEKFENASFDIGYISIVSGGRNLVILQNGSYTNVDLGGSLAPRSPNRMILFDNYGGASSVGVVNRLFSNCITIPANTAGSCGNYQLSFWMSRDSSYSTALDSLYVVVTTNGGTTWTRLGSGFQRYDASFITPGWQKQVVSLAAYAGQTIQIGFENVSKYGNIIALDDIEISSERAGNVVLATSASNSISLQRSCDDQGWTYYVNSASPTQALIAIQWDPSNTGANAVAKLAAIPRLQVDGTFFSATDVPSKTATFTAKRYWNVNLPTGSLSTPVNLRFFYSPADTAEVNQAAANFAAANAGTLETPMWFKTVGPDFIANSSMVIPDGVIGAVPLTNVNTSGATINGVLYAQFNGITSFSGGTYATGVGINTPVPVNLVTFTAQRVSSRVNQLQWTTAQEQQSLYFELERSTDGRRFVSIGQLAAAGNSNTARTYQFTDQQPTNGVNYYRLKLVDQDQSFRYSGIRQVRNQGVADLSIFPNPVKEQLTASIQTDKAGIYTWIITDASGKVVYQRQQNLLAGPTTIQVPTNRLQAGSYFFKLQSADDLIIRKFTKY